MSQAAIAIAPPGRFGRVSAPLRPSRTLRLLTFVALMMLCHDHPALAQSVAGGGTGSLTTFLTNIVNLLTGPLGQSIAVIAVAAVGIAWALGQASPRFALGTVVGVAILFSSAWIVGQISGTGG